MVRDTCHPIRSDTQMEGNGFNTVLWTKKKEAIVFRTLKHIEFGEILQRLREKAGSLYCLGWEMRKIGSQIDGLCHLWYSEIVSLQRGRLPVINGVITPYKWPYTYVIVVISYLYGSKKRKTFISDFWAHLVESVWFFGDKKSILSTSQAPSRRRNWCEASPHNFRVLKNTPQKKTDGSNTSTLLVVHPHFPSWFTA